MAGIKGLLSAATPLLSLKFLIVQDVKSTAEVSTSSALPLAQVAASTPRAVAESASVSSATPIPLARLPVATLTPRESTAARAGNLNGAPTHIAQPLPPQIILETKYIVFTEVKTAAPLYITITQTVQREPPSTLDEAKSHFPSANTSQHPNAVSVSKPNPLVLSSAISSLSPEQPTRLAGVASAPSSHPQIPPASSASKTPAATSLIPVALSSPPPPSAATASAATFPGTAKPPSSAIAPIMSAPELGRGGSSSSNPNPQAQTDLPGGLPMGIPDPADGAFLGGVPNKSLDLPLTIVFMILFMLGAYVHLTIYRRNAKRGHKFLISDIVFDFCMIRTVTCIFRITWSIVATRGVVLVALITENGGAALMFAVNIFFAQRLIRSIHPKAGWCTAFGQFTFVLLISVPAFILLNMVSTIISFFSVGNADRLELMDDLLKLGGTWNTWLSIFPVLVVSGCLCVPGPTPERFGSGSQRVKVALLYAGAFLLITGQSIRLYSVFNKEPPGTTSVIYSKTVFYTTGFMFEVLVVALYAIMRVDQRFYIPNGSSGPGDYSGDKQREQYSVEEIEQLVDSLEVPHKIMRERKGPEDMEMVFTIFFATKKKANGNDKERPKVLDETMAGGDLGEEGLSKSPKRITRRRTLIDAIKVPPRPPIASSIYPDRSGTHRRMDGRGYPPPRPQRPSMYSQFETGQGYDVRYREDWGASPPYGDEKGPERF